MTELLIAKQPDLIGIVETWLDVSVSHPAVFCGLPYTVIGRFNRPERQHGGLLLAISNSLSNSIEVSDARIEELFISCLLKFESSYLGLVLVYLLPKGSKFYVSMSEKLRFVMTNFEKMRVSNCSGELHTIILGDFNFPSVNWDCMKSSRSDEQILIDFLAQDFLIDQIIRNPTHKHENILDLAFVSQAEAWDYELLSSKLSDHTPVLLTYSAKYIPCNNFLSEYSLSSFDETAFLQSLNIDSRLPNSPISCSELLASYVHSLFSFILQTTCWPLFWKCAHVTPIHKKGLKSDIENYRPISILPRLSLVFERIFFNYLYSKIRHKINSNQHGFQQGHSTITQLVLFIDELYANFDNNWEQIVLYLDFKSIRFGDL